jgi:hypothetical protein
MAYRIFNKTRQMWPINLPGGNSVYLSGMGSRDGSDSAILLGDEELQSVDVQNLLAITAIGYEVVTPAPVAPHPTDEIDNG